MSREIRPQRLVTVPRKESNPESGRQRFELEVDRESDPIEGELTDGTGRRRSFSGWLQLMSMLQRANVTEDTKRN
jgi:hypothetical protein